MSVKYQTALLKELLALKEAVDAGQIHRAAEKNGFRQTNFSKLLKDLESRFGITLFQRTSTGLIPTNAARTLYPEIQAIDTALNKIEAAHVKEENLTGNLTMWMDEEFSENPILKPLSLFYACYPKISLHLLTDKKTDLRSVDVVVIDKSAHAVPPHSTPLFECKTHAHFYTSRDYLEKHGHPKNLSDFLENYDICLRQFYLNMPECYFLLKQAQHLNTISDSGTVIMRLVRDGDGVALLPDWCKNIYQDLVRLENVDFALVQHFIAYTPRTEQPAKLQLFTNFMREAALDHRLPVSFFD